MNMKKILYTGLFAAAFLLVGCQSDDYNDWADPMSNPQENASGVISSTIVASQSSISKADLGEVKTIPLIQFVGAENFDVSTVVFKKVYLNDHEIPFLQGEEDVTVTVNDLDSVVRTMYKSIAYQERQLTTKADIALVDADGVGISTVSNDVTINYLPENLIPAIHQQVESAYYYVGGYNNWSLGSPTPMKDNGDGSFSVVLELGANEWFCFAPQSAVDAQNWGGLLRAPSNSYEVPTGFFGLDPSGANSNDSFKMTVEEPGKYQFTIWPADYYYEFAPYVETLYYAGDSNGWGFSPMVKVGDEFVGYYYIYQPDNDTTWGFKLTTDPSWDNPQYGAGDGDYTIALGGGNIQISEPSGFYQLKVNTGSATYSLTPITQMSLIGSAVNGDSNWGTDYDLTFNTETMAWEGTFEMTDGEFKIRANHDWALSWGGELDAMTSQNGANLSITAGTYKFSFQPNSDGHGVLTIEAQ